MFPHTNCFFPAEMGHVPYGFISYRTLIRVGKLENALHIQPYRRITESEVGCHIVQHWYQMTHSISFKMTAVTRYIQIPLATLWRLQYFQFNMTWKRFLPCYTFPYQEYSLFDLLHYMASIVIIHELPRLKWVPFRTEYGGLHIAAVEDTPLLLQAMLLQSKPVKNWCIWRCKYIANK